MQTEAPAIEYLPATQAVQTEAPAPEYLPAKQLMQVLATVAPTVVEYLPAGHDVQAAAAEEVDPTGPYVPAAHTEPEQVDAPTTAEYLPAAQSEQVSLALAP
jgi:hypothetical protein